MTVAFSYLWNVCRRSTQYSGIVSTFLYSPSSPDLTCFMQNDLCLGNKHSIRMYWTVIFFIKMFIVICGFGSHYMYQKLTFILSLFGTTKPMPGSGGRAQICFGEVSPSHGPTPTWLPSASSPGRGGYLRDSRPWQRGGPVVWWHTR